MPRIYMAGELDFFETLSRNSTQFLVLKNRIEYKYNYCFIILVCMENI